MCDSDIPACNICSATSHPRWLSRHDTPSCGTLILHNAYWSLIFIMKRRCFAQLIMYSPQLSQLAVAGSGLTVVSHTVLPHSFSLKPPVVLWFYTDSPSRALSLFCPLIGLYIRVFSEIVLISPSLLLLAVSRGDQKPKQVRRTTRHDAKIPDDVDKYVRACFQQRGPVLKRRLWDLV